MDGYVENGDVSGGHCFMNSHTLSEAKNNNSIDSTNKRDGNFPNVSEMEGTGLQGKKALLCYSICWSLLALQFWSNFRSIPALYPKVPAFYANIFPLSYTVYCLRSWPWRDRVLCTNNGGGGGHADGKKLFMDVRAKLFRHAIYCSQDETRSRVPVRITIPWEGWRGDLHISIMSITS